MVDQWFFAPLRTAGLAAAACGSAPMTTPGPAGTPVPVGSVVVDGLVDRPTLFSVADLAALPGLDVNFSTHGGTQHHVEAGPLLVDVLAKVGPRFDRRAKNGELRDFVVVTGADGYEAVLSYGEIAPTFGDRPALLSVKEEGVVLAAPRLVIPGDVMGGATSARWCTSSWAPRTPAGPDVPPPSGWRTWGDGPRTEDGLGELVAMLAESVFRLCGAGSCSAPPPRRATRACGTRHGRTGAPYAPRCRCSAATDRVAAALRRVAVGRGDPSSALVDGSIWGAWGRRPVPLGAVG
jgi:hypothetical protein